MDINFKGIKLRNIILIALIVISAFANDKKVQTIELLGDNDYAPYSYIKDGEPKGVYVRIIQAAFDKMPEYNVKFRMIAWKRSIALVKKGKAIGFFPPYYSKERTAWTKFSEPILAEKSNIFALEKTLKGKKKFPEDFYGSTICLNTGFTLMTGGIKMKTAIEDGKLKLIRGACLGSIFRGLADVYINDQLVDISEFPEIKKGLVVAKNFGHIGFTLKKERYPYIDTFEKKFNKVIRKMKASGEIDKILKNHIRN